MLLRIMARGKYFYSAIQEYSENLLPNRAHARNCYKIQFDGWWDKKKIYRLDTFSRVGIGMILVSKI